MKIHQIQVGNMQNFTYVVEDEETSEAIIIDPSWDLDKIEQVVSRNNLKIKFVVNTHHHFDHTLGNEAVSKSFNAKIMQHENSNLNHDISIKDNDFINFGRSTLKVLHTPGHSKDSICLIGDGKIFTGDTLFVGNCGRIDLPGGSAEELYDSLQILANLDDNLIIFSGHNYGETPYSTIGKEKKTNYVLQKRDKTEFVKLMGG